MALDMELTDLIDRALREDIGHQDITTANLIPEGNRSQGVFTVKSSGVIAGLDIAAEVFRFMDTSIVFEPGKVDGDRVDAGEEIARITGSTRTILTGERTALNFLQHLSGIATRTRRMADIIADYPAKLVDTRKTAPGLRYLEKYAVKIGGANNHRFGLYDGVMIKDNHIKAAGGITQAVNIIRGRVPHTVKIEIEVASIRELHEALTAGADIIMLDNMDIASMKEAVALTAGKALLEASGGITEENLEAVAQTGVDYISVGALTHSVSSLDISLNIVMQINTPL